MALMGVNKELTDPFQRGFVSIPLASAGLLDLAFFHAASETRDGGKAPLSTFMNQQIRKITVVLLIFVGINFLLIE